MEIPERIKRFALDVAGPNSYECQDIKFRLDAEREEILKMISRYKATKARLLERKEEQEKVLEWLKANEIEIQKEDQ